MDSSNTHRLVATGSSETVPGELGERATRRQFLSLVTGAAATLAAFTGRASATSYPFKLGIITDEISDDLAEALDFITHYSLGYCEVREIWHGCGSTCCAGFSEFCCSVNGGYNYCPTNTVMGGWWKADNSSYCGGPRYYMDCNATCQCDDGCGNGFGFCDTDCDGTECGCGPDGCDSYLTGCFQFRYGQCNQQIDCIGRIVCRVVACVPPWEVDPTCTMTNAEDDGTAEQDAACWTPAPPAPPPAPCSSPLTNCEVVGMASSLDGTGYALVTSFGKLFAYGVFPDDGDESTAHLVEPIVGLTGTPADGYYLVAADGGIFAYDAPFYGSMGGRPLNQPMVGMAATLSGKGYWTVASDGGIFAFGDAPFHGSMGGVQLNKPVVGMAATPTGLGYWLVASDGGIFAFGDAPYHGSMGGTQLNKPVVGMAANTPPPSNSSTAPTPPTGSSGYWMVAADGGIFAFDAPFLGSPA